MTAEDGFGRGVNVERIDRRTGDPIADAIYDTLTSPQVLDANGDRDANVVDVLDWISHALYVIARALNPNDPALPPPPSRRRGTRIADRKELLATDLASLWNQRLPESWPEGGDAT